VVSFGPSREARRPRGGWQPRSGRPGWRAWLAVAAGAAVAGSAFGLVTTGGGPPRAVGAPSASAQPLPPLLAGVPAHRARTDMFLGGENFWRLGGQMRAVAAGFLRNGLSALLPAGDGAEVDQMFAVPGGVVAHISDISTGITYGALGPVVFLPAANVPARVIARATMIAVSPSGRQVWVQNAVQTLGNGAGVPADFRSPTWAVNLAGRRVSPVLGLPFGLVAATESGPLTQNLDTGELQRWDGGTGRLISLPPGLPPNEDFMAAGRDRVIWSSCSGTCVLHVTDLDTDAGAEVPLPAGWYPLSETYPPPPASLDPSGRLLALPLERVDSSGNVTAEALFVADTATATLRMIRGTSLPLSSLPPAEPVTLIGAWDRQGLLWVLASSPYEGYCQLGFWAGGGPLRTFAFTRGSPVALSAPGPG
jgi:hypothetical protein